MTAAELLELLHHYPTLARYNTEVFCIGFGNRYRIERAETGLNHLTLATAAASEQRGGRPITVEEVKFVDGQLTKLLTGRGSVADLSVVRAMLIYLLAECGYHRHAHALTANLEESIGALESLIRSPTNQRPN